MFEARKHGNEASAIGALKTIGTSQSLFREGDYDKDGVLDYGTLRELADQDLVDVVLGEGTKQGYLFATAPGASTSEFLWFATATPAIPTTTGDRYFATNHEGVTYYRTDKAFQLDAQACEIPEDAQPVGR